MAYRWIRILFYGIHFPYILRNSFIHLNFHIKILFSLNNFALLNRLIMHTHPFVENVRVYGKKSLPYIYFRVFFGMEWCIVLLESFWEKQTLTLNKEVIVELCFGFSLCLPWIWLCYILFKPPHWLHFINININIPDQSTLLHLIYPIRLSILLLRMIRKFNKRFFLHFFLFGQMDGLAFIKNI